MRLVCALTPQYCVGRQKQRRIRNRQRKEIKVQKFIEAFELTEPRQTGQPFVVIHPSIEKQVKMLKLLTSHYVILNPSLATQQYGQRRIIRTLVEVFHEAAAKGNGSVFPLGV